MYKKLIRIISSTFFILFINSSALEAQGNPSFKLNTVEKIATSEKHFYKVDFSYEFNERDTIFIDELGVVPAKGNFAYLTNKNKIEFKDSPNGSVLEIIELNKFVNQSNQQTVNSEPSNNIPTNESNQQTVNSGPSNNIPTNNNGGCAIIDTTSRVRIRSSREASEQNNNVNIEDGNKCLHNTVVSTTTQVGIQENDQTNYFVGGVNSKYIATIEIPDEKDFREVARHEDWHSPPIFQKAAFETLNKIFPSGVMPFQRYNTFFFITPYVDLKSVPDNLNSQVALLISLPLENNFFRIQVLHREKRQRESKWTFNVSDHTIKASNNFINEIVNNLDNYRNQSQ